MKKITKSVSSDMQAVWSVRKTVGSELCAQWNVFDFQTQYLWSARGLIDAAGEDADKMTKQAYLTSSILLSFVAFEAALTRLSLRKAKDENQAKAETRKLEAALGYGPLDDICAKISEHFGNIELNLSPEFSSKKRIYNAIKHHSTKNGVFKQLKIYEDLDTEARECFEVCFDEIKELYIKFGYTSDFKAVKALVIGREAD